jgi:hypothetical protein
MNKCIEQTYFLIQSDMINKKTIQYLETIVNCRVMVEASQHEKDTMEGLVQMALSKNSGFSYLEVRFR